MSLGCVKAFSILRNLTRRDVADKVHNKISQLNSNYVTQLKDPVDISQISFGNRLLLATFAWGNRQQATVFGAGHLCRKFKKKITLASVSMSV